MKTACFLFPQRNTWTNALKEYFRNLNTSGCLMLPV